MIVDGFKRLFHQKKDDSMERRAEESRIKKRDKEVEETHDIFDKTHKNLNVDLDHLIDEIKGKKSG